MHLKFRPADFFLVLAILYHNYAFIRIRYRHRSTAGETQALFILEPVCVALTRERYGRGAIISYVELVFIQEFYYDEELNGQDDREKPDQIFEPSGKRTNARFHAMHMAFSLALGFIFR